MSPDLFYSLTTLLALNVSRSAKTAFLFPLHPPAPAFLCPLNSPCSPSSLAGLHLLVLYHRDGALSELQYGQSVASVSLHVFTFNIDFTPVPVSLPRICWPGTLIFSSCTILSSWLCSDACHCLIRLQLPFVVEHWGEKSLPIVSLGSIYCMT